MLRAINRQNYALVLSNDPSANLPAAAAAPAAPTPPGAAGALTARLRSSVLATQIPELVRADSEITERLDAATLDGVFDLDTYKRHVDTVFERLHALRTREEPVHA